MYKSTGGLKTTTLWNATWTDQLKHDLLLKYDKFARPAQHYNTTVVTINLVIRHVEVVSSLKKTSYYCVDHTYFLCRIISPSVYVSLYIPPHTKLLFIPLN